MLSVFAPNMPQRKMRMLSLKKEGLGNPTIAGSCDHEVTITDTGVGDYLLTFDTPFQDLPEVLLTPTTNDRICRVGTVAVGSVQIITEDLAGAAAEGDCHILIMGSDARDRF